jgi:hypothetical protein
MAFVAANALNGAPETAEIMHSTNAENGSDPGSLRQSQRWRFGRMGNSRGVLKAMIRQEDSPLIPVFCHSSYFSPAVGRMKLGSANDNSHPSKSRHISLLPANEYLERRNAL